LAKRNWGKYPKYIKGKNISAVPERGKINENRFVFLLRHWKFARDVKDDTSGYRPDTGDWKPVERLHFRRFMGLCDKPI
jgi:hypothetical protein